MDFSVAGEKHEINAAVQLLERAIRQKKQVQFTYTNQQDETKERLVEPAGLVYKYGVGLHEGAFFVGGAHRGKECRKADYGKTFGETEGKGKVQRILKR